jgi:hypothetical protein
MNFVTFHVQRRALHEIHPDASVVDLDNVRCVQMVEMMFASAERAHRNIIRTILTDSTSDLSYLQCEAVRVEQEVRPHALMRDRAAAQARYFDTYGFDKPVVLLDSDVLLFRSLAPVFEFDFDIAVTWRKRDEMPINNGLIVVNNKRPHIVRQFFRRYVEIFDERYLADADWYGDQMALQDVVGCRREDFSDYRIVDASGCKVLLLPCSEYNFTPGKNLRKLAWPSTRRAVYHFKGRRKPQMVEFWELHFSGLPKVLAILKVALARVRQRRSRGTVSG